MKMRIGMKMRGIGLFLLTTAMLILSACGAPAGGATTAAAGENTTAAATTTAAGGANTTTTVAAATTAVGAADTATDAVTQADGEPWSAPDTFPIVAEPVTYNIMASMFDSSGPFVDNTMLQDYEKHTNVKINWENVSNSDQNTKLALSLSSGVYPDAYFNFFISTAQQLIYGGQGILIPLQDMIAAQAPNVTNCYELYPEILENSVAPDGNIYSLFQYDPSLHMKTNQKMFLNKNWLEQGGLEMPTTLEEFKEVLTYFRDNDMNGNGDPGDEIPLVGDSGKDVATFLINSFILNPNRGLLVTDDVVAPIYNTEEYREALRYVHGLFAEGLIGTESFTQDGNALSALVNRPEEMIVGGVGTTMYQGFFMNIDLFLDGYGAETFSPVPPLLGPAGKAQTPMTDSGVLVGRSIQITSECVNPTILIKWMDYWYNEENAFMQQEGYEGVDYEWVDEEAIDGSTPAYRKFVGTNPTPVTRILMNQGPMLYTNEMRYRQLKELGSGGLALYEDSVMYQKYQDPNQKYLPFTIWMDEETARTTSQLETTIDTFVKESRAKFIVGDLDLEADWDSYVNELDAMGLEQFVTTYQDVYDTANK